MPNLRSSTAAAKMSTFSLPDSDVTVNLVNGLSKEELLAFPAFKVDAFSYH